MLDERPQRQREVLYRQWGLLCGRGDLLLRQRGRLRGRAELRGVQREFWSGQEDLVCGRGGLVCCPWEQLLEHAHRGCLLLLAGVRSGRGCLGRPYRAGGRCGLRRIGPRDRAAAGESRWGVGWEVGQLLGLALGGQAASVSCSPRVI